MRDKRRETRIERGRGEGGSKRGVGERERRGGGIIRDKSKRENEKKNTNFIGRWKKIERE